MKDAVPAAPAPVRLEDYTPFPWQIEAVSLSFALSPEATRVTSRIRFVPSADAPARMFLHGEDLTLISARIDGQNVSVTPVTGGIEVPVPEGAFTWDAVVEINPAANTALEGLYMSNGMYCTQCEAEGFRKITYYPDRPDVMAPFKVRVESELPVLLSNGNPAGAGEGFAEWHDPHPKPAYLFALVAGDLVAHSENFTTASGAPVDLNIWVRPGDEGKCAFAMDALIRSMRWDETEYGREYDLDVFNIVAVDDFNMGAMENKGLNIFNSKYVLASPQTATDRDYDFIEGIIAHEYFHNWTGNRITCRDWFQLCLKEGLTVFRDQQFSADMRSGPVKRIEDVLQLRARQFREDAGPLAHNVRPESYIEINNFYTATVYEKGAEVIRMLRILIGAELYRAGVDLYFDRHDGQACTIEDWLACFEEVSGRDLSQFKRWYSQAGTPKVRAEWTRDGGRFTLRLSQEVPPTPGQPMKEPAVIPVLLGLLDGDGAEIVPTTLVTLDGPSAEVSFDLAKDGDAPEHVVPSLLRGFSAPVLLDADLSAEDRAVLLAHDTDPFNRWEAGRSLVREMLVAEITAPDEASTTEIKNSVHGALGRVLSDDTLDPAFRALVLSFPSEDDLAQAVVDAGVVPDPVRINAVRRDERVALAAALEGPLRDAYAAFDPGPDYSPDAESAAKRALRNTAMGLLGMQADPELARQHFETATNMTDQTAALAVLIGNGDREASAAFEAQWRDDRLVMDKWFMLSVGSAPAADAVEIAEALTEHPLFDWKNPNRFRSLMAGLTSGNPAAFHAASGAGYRFFADWLLKLDAVNPQTTARMSTAFETWKRYDADRQQMMQDQLARIAGAEGLSRDLGEMVARMRAV